MIDIVSIVMITTTKVMIDFVQEHSLTTILDSASSMELPVGGEVLILLILLLLFSL